MDTTRPAQKTSSGFDRVARMVARTFGTPMAVVTRIDESAQGFFACVGLEAGSVPLEESFCNRAIVEGLDLMVVEDATRDPRFADYASVTGGMKVRFYAGAVFRDRAGRAIGAVAAVDTRPHDTPSAEQLETLADLAALSGELLEEARLRREKKARLQLLEMAEQIAGLGHWRVDLKSQAVSWSDEVYRIHGVDPETFDPNLGGAIDFYHPDDRAAVESFIQRIVETGEPGEFQQRLIRADGEERRVISRAMLQRDDEGAPAALFGVFQDVTERIRAQEAAARAKDEFLSNMSHELRTPLTSVIGFAGLLKASDGLGEMERRYADRISTASEALLSVINDILDYSKLEAGAVEMDPQPFDLEAWAQGAIGLVESQCGKKGLAISVEVAAGAPEALIGDEGRLRQVLLNFLSNACKFTAEGGVSVVLGGTPVAGGWRLRVAVTDTGVGIAEERIDALFERFTQADQSTTRTYGGTGLGLAISRRLIELMGGEIGASSRPGEGSTFWFEVTLPMAGAIGAEAPQDGGDVQDLRGARILLVDDSAANRDMVGALLENLGLQVETATDGAEGVEALRRGGHDLVLMDVQMPGMDGLAATRAIRALDEAVAKTPIVALTANVQPEHVTRCREAGMDDHVAKPVSPAALAETIARHLRDETSVTACVRRRPA
ncbi:ATP-binding protein [Brevundimonas sp.]|uniref:ATP-binding protein n=1 Tax=Brevundimonas sp. TaxID=1871086 RepID=UPI0035B3D75F